MGQVHLQADSLEYLHMAVYGPAVKRSAVTQEPKPQVQNKETLTLGSNKKDASPKTLARAREALNQALGYDEPSAKESQAIGYYQAIATYAKREEIKQWVGIDTYV